MIEEENSTNTGQGVGGIGPGCKEAIERALEAIKHQELAAVVRSKIYAR